MTEDAGKWPWNVLERFVYVGVTDAAGVHLDQHLTSPGLRLRNICDLPRTVLRGYNGGFHKVHSPGARFGKGSIMVFGISLFIGRW
jgi:hypothetical protein